MIITERLREAVQRQFEQFRDVAIPARRQIKECQKFIKHSSDKEKIKQYKEKISELEKAMSINRPVNLVCGDCDDIMRYIKPYIRCGEMGYLYQCDHGHRRRI